MQGEFFHFCSFVPMKFARLLYLPQSYVKFAKNMTKTEEKSAASVPYADRSDTV